MQLVAGQVLDWPGKKNMCVCVGVCVCVDMCKPLDIISVKNTSNINLSGNQIWSEVDFLEKIHGEISSLSSFFGVGGDVVG